MASLRSTTWTSRAPAGAALWARWVGANGLAEAAGLGATLALDAAIMLALAAERSVAGIALGILLFTATGALEGTIVGLLQWLVLRRPFPRIARRSWVLATVAGALAAWFLGSLPSTLIDMSAAAGAAPIEEPPPLMIYALAAGMGLVLGPVLAMPQWLALRRHARGAWIWVPANSLAWALGMPVIFMTIDLAQRVAAPIPIVLTLLAGLFAAGAVVGAVHGVALVKLARRV